MRSLEEGLDHPIINAENLVDLYGLIGGAVDFEIPFSDRLLLLGAKWIRHGRGGTNEEQANSRVTHLGQGLGNGRIRLCHDASFDSQQFCIERVDCHLADNVVGLSLISLVDDGSPCLEIQHRGGGGAAVGLSGQLAWSNDKVVDLAQRLLDLANMIACGPLRNMRSIVNEARFERRITLEEGRF